MPALGNVLILYANTDRDEVISIVAILFKKKGWAKVCFNTERGEGGVVENNPSLLSK